MKKSDGILSLKKAAKLLNKHAPDGESLAYINPEEARLLKSHGGSGIMTLQGVPTYFLSEAWGWVKDTAAPAVYNWLGYDNEKGGGGSQMLKDIASLWGGYEGMKESKELSEWEKQQYQEQQAKEALNTALFAGQTDSGAQLLAPQNVPTDTTAVSAYRPIDFSGSATPDLTTTAVAEGGRIGYNAGGLTQYEIFKLKELGYPKAASDPGSYGGVKVLKDILKLHNYAQGGRIGASNGGIQSLNQQLNSLPEYYMPYPAAQGGRIGYGEGSGLGSKDFVDKIYSDEARTLAGNIPEVRARGGDYAPTLFEERENNEWKYPGKPRPGQEYLTSTLQGANTELDRMEMQKIKLKELAAEKGLDFNDLFEREFNRIIETEGPATKDITKIRDRERILNLIKRKLEDDVYAQDGTFTSQGRTFKLRTPMGKKKLSSHAQGGRIGAQEGGVMPLLNLGGMEKDYREDGGFVPLGRQEKADDVPARLSKNEFVFTADAVKAAGGGDIDAGAEIMENVMENLEQGGQVSEESQGLEGARNMFATAQRLGGVI